MEQIYLLVFNNTQGAIKAEAYLRANSVKVTIMPTPTQITRSCGISLIVSKEQIEAVEVLLVNGEIDYKGFYERKNREYFRV